jgi:GNAT superfamily N-acetyltransferase
MTESVATCVCGIEFSAADDDAVVALLTAHVDESDHGAFKVGPVYWRNLVEAPRRLQGPTDRLDALGQVEVHDLSVDRLQDWLEFFDHRAFADFPYWASCYCNAPFLDDLAMAEERAWQDNRDEMMGRIERGDAWGVIAYVDGVMAGWCNASPLAGYPQYRRGRDEDETVGAVMCFVIAAPYRRHGLARSLLDGAVDQFRRRGMTAVVGYPAARPGTGGGPQGPPSLFHGPLSLYEDAGFVKIRDVGPVIIMRKHLT